MGGVGGGGWPDEGREETRRRGGKLASGSDLIHVCCPGEETQLCGPTAFWLCVRITDGERSGRRELSIKIMRSTLSVHVHMHTCAEANRRLMSDGPGSN